MLKEIGCLCYWSQAKIKKSLRAQHLPSPTSTNSQEKTRKQYIIAIESATTMIVYIEQLHEFQVDFLG